MNPYFETVKEVAERIDSAVKNSIDALNAGRVEQEPAMTDRMLGAIEQSVDGFSNHGIRWRAKTLTDRGSHAQESLFGADFLVVLDVDVPGYRVTKGFLAQAKLVRGGRSGNLSDLRDQCRKMLSISPDSFVFLYGSSGVQVVPAVSVVGTAADPTDLPTRSAFQVFRDHLECFIGDPWINAPGLPVFRQYRMFYQPRDALMLRAEEDK